ncbi:MAG: ChaN family lipoprotein [Phycisphaeraceae bacterium]|nr:ChaN family lipoprotein [Phycisphaeraceae bacterium]
MRYAIALVMAALLLPACASNRPAPAPAPDAEAIPVLPDLAGVLGASRIFTGDGADASWDEIVARSADADVVLIGETHGHPVGLPMAAHLFEEIVARRPGAALSMEFLERDQQSIVDDYLSGVIDRKGYSSLARRTASNEPPGHRAMLETARENHLPVIAANAPRRHVTLARKEGYDRLRALTDEQRRLFAIPAEMPSGRYRDDFFELMGSMMGDGAHGEPAEQTPEAISAQRQMIENTFRSQSLWDSTMADSIGKALDAGRRPVVHVIGRFHVDFGGGTVQMLRQGHPAARIIVISMVNEPPPQSLADEDHERADFVAYVGPLPDQTGN